MDCRYRPLDQPFDRFNARLNQTSKDYFISDNWSDEEIKQFRMNVRRHNICVRHSFPYHSRMLEHMRVPKEYYVRLLESDSRLDIIKEVPDAWFPGDFSPPVRNKVGN